MSKNLDNLKRLIDEVTDDERVGLLDYLKTRLPAHLLEKEWGVGADVILSAIARSSDLTKRGVRGIIAEAIFERSVLGDLGNWEILDFLDDRPYDFLIRSRGSDHREVRIQVKLQRMRKQQPMLAAEANRHYPKEMYVVEVQKTRGGIDQRTKKNTRPYRFGEFDILAVNLHPSTGKWDSFMFTVGSWLIPRREDNSLIEIFQPVSQAANAEWTDRLDICLDWLNSGERRKVLDIDPKLLRQFKKKRKRKVAARRIRT